MGRAIDEDKPLSDEDRAYLQERSMRHVIETIDRVTLGFPQEGIAIKGDDTDDEDAVDVDADISEFVEGLSDEQVKERLELEEVDSDGVADEDLKALLAVSLQDKRNAGETVELTA